MSKRYFGLDIAKGIAVLGMIASHSFMGTVARWDSALLFNFVSNIPKFLMCVLMIPVVLLSQMGSLFSLISSMCVTLSFLNLSRKGKSSVWQYIWMKMIFALLLRGIAIFWNQFSINFPFFERRIMQWPIISIPFDSDTLDCIGFLGWFIPLFLYILRSIPFLMDYRIQIAILYILSLVISYFSRSLSSYGVAVTNWCSNNGLFFIAFLFSKIGSGPFQITQILPFGMVGSALGLLFNSCDKYINYLVFSVVICVINGVFGGLMLTKVDDFVTELFESFRPEGFMLIMLGIQPLFILWCCYLVDNPRRIPVKRLGSLKRTTYLRRINSLSLTAFIMEPFLSKKMLTLFQIPFGAAADHTTKICNWSWPVVALYCISTTLVAVLIARLWEFGGFRFSAESQLSLMMTWLFGQPYSKVEYKRNIYGPITDVNDEINHMAASSEVEIMMDQLTPTQEIVIN